MAMRYSSAIHLDVVGMQQAWISCNRDSYLKGVG